MTSPASRSSTAAGPWIAFGVCTAVWGSTFLAIALGNESMPAVWSAALRLALASAILFVVMAARRQPLPRGAALRAALVFGFFQFGLNFPLLYLGEKEVPSGLAAVLFATIPLSQAVLTHAVGLERFHPTKLIAAVIALAGVGLIFANQLQGHVRPLSLVCIVLATWAACVGSVALKRGPRQSPIGSNAVGTALGAVVCLGWSYAIREAHPLPDSPQALLPILYLAILGSVVAFVVFAWLLNHWEVTRASYIAFLTPMFALMLGSGIRHERIPPVSWAGSAVVLIGVAIGLRPRGRESAAA